MAEFGTRTEELEHNVRILCPPETYGFAKFLQDSQSFYFSVDDVPFVIEPSNRSFDCYSGAHRVAKYLQVGGLRPGLSFSNPRSNAGLFRDFGLHLSTPQGSILIRTAPIYPVVANGVSDYYNSRQFDQRDLSGDQVGCLNLTPHDNVVISRRSVLDKSHIISFFQNLGTMHYGYNKRSEYPLGTNPYRRGVNRFDYLTAQFPLEQEDWEGNVRWVRAMAYPDANNEYVLDPHYFSATRIPDIGNGFKCFSTSDDFDEVKYDPSFFPLASVDMPVLANLACGLEYAPPYVELDPEKHEMVLQFFPRIAT